MMVRLVVLIIFILNLNAVEPVASSGTIDIAVFGKSYHANRNAGYNGDNPGVGLGISFTGDEYINILIDIGTYKDSYKEAAKFVMTGLQFVGGDRNGFHVSPGLLVGYMEGSGKKGFIPIPLIAIGYDKFDLCITGDPTGANNTVHNPDGTVNLNKSSSMSVAFFFKLSVVKWK